MRRRSSWGHVGVVLASFALATSTLGCPLLKKLVPEQTDAEVGDEDDEDAAAAAVADAETVDAAGLGAKNEANVLRYANETPLPNEPALVGEKGARARNFPGNGPEVAFLPKGTPVVKIAQYFSTGTLIVFDDPSGDGTRLMGWVTPSAFDATTPAPSPSPPPSPTPTPTPTAPPSSSDAGAKLVVDAGAKPQDAGAAPIVDAGAKPVDAGVKPAVKDAGTPAKVVDAGGGSPSNTIPQPAKGVLAVPPVNGKCPDGWAVAENMCRRKCTADGECPRGTKCATKSGVKVCTSDF